MWSIIKHIFISVIIIYIAHTLWNYILEVCTTKKKKNLVQFQNEKYSAILDSLTKKENTCSVNNDYSSLGMTEEEIEHMKETLLKDIDVTES